jgi:hypothetical protein
MKNSTMKYKAVLLAITPLAATINPSAASGEEQVLLRYQPSAAQLSLSIESEIMAGEKEQPVAGRTFSMQYETSAEAGPETLSYKLADARVSYTAHGMNQRLGTNHLLGREFGLEITDQGRGLHLNGHHNSEHEHGGHGHSAHDHNAQENEAQGIELDLGPVTDHGYGLDQALAALLPQLPEESVGIGSAWKTQQDTLTLVGWSWAQGQLQCEHEVVNLSQAGDHLLASIHSECSTTLAAIEGSDQYSGDGKLSRKTQWQFDATEGRLVSLAGQQESNGFSALPQGNVQIRQFSTISLSSEG